MKTGIVKTMMVLAALAALSGCSSILTLASGDANDRAILSAAEAQSTIRVTVTQLEPIDVEQPAIVAAK
ncbi:MAG: hypothetical protein OET44_21230 [Gammaproteobacteria bacterium]|nr:hypothetical protein [Gammaproteobacteria bacterium]